MKPDLLALIVLTMLASVFAAGAVLYVGGSLR